VGIDRIGEMRELGGDGREGEAGARARGKGEGGLAGVWETGFPD
jgi:hypothetical protein